MNDYEIAITVDDVDAIAYLRSIHCPIPDNAIILAVRNASVSALTYLVNTMGLWADHEEIEKEALMRCDIPVLSALYDLGYKWQWKEDYAMTGLVIKGLPKSEWKADVTAKFVCAKDLYVTLNSVW
jgi:hypothetical protein